MHCMKQQQVFQWIHRHFVKRRKILFLDQKLGAYHSVKVNSYVSESCIAFREPIASLCYNVHCICGSRQYTTPVQNTPHYSRWFTPYTHNIMHDAMCIARGKHLMDNILSLIYSILRMYSIRHTTDKGIGLEKNICKDKIQ